MKNAFILFLLTTLLFSCNKPIKDTEKQDLSFERFAKKFRKLKGDTILIDTTFISKAAFSKNVLLDPIIEKYLIEDSMSIFTIGDEDTTFTFFQSIIATGRINFSGLDFEGYISRITTGTKSHFYNIIRLYLFKDQKLHKSHNIAIFAKDKKSHLGADVSNNYIITTTIIDSVIYQYKVSLLYREEPTKQERLGGSDKYYFLIQDTLETSKLVLQENGELMGKNLTKVAND